MNSKKSESQKQTQNTFGFKWGKQDTYESKAVQSEWKRWLYEKYFDNDPEKLNQILKVGEKRKKILDAGCGSGVSSINFFGDHLKNHDFLGVDISNATKVAEKRFHKAKLPGTFIQSDLNSIPKELGPFDIIFSEGVLHHTDSVEKAICNLSKLLKNEGTFMFYVYVKKAPIREYTDDLIRKEISSMDNEEAWEALLPLTKLGKKLGELNIEIEIDDDIPYLGVNKGKHNLQNLFYYKVLKAYYRDDYNLEEMNHINFDWFRPTNCFRHTPSEIKNFCKKANLKIERMHIGESGITVIAKK